MNKLANNRFFALTFVLAAGLALGAVLPAVSAISAYATDSGNATSSASSADQGHDKWNQVGNSTNTDRDDHKSNNTAYYHYYKSKVEQMRAEFALMNADKRHQAHMLGHAPITPPYFANLSYTLDANGNSTMSDPKHKESSSLMIDMSIWKSSDTLVAMDITGGNITVGNNMTTINGGHAYYLPHHPRLIIYAYTIQNTGSSTASPEMHGVKVLRIFAFADSRGSTLPTNSSASPFAVHVSGLESGHGSHVFKMSGQVSMNLQAGSSRAHITRVAILPGASVSGHPAYGPDNATATVGDIVAVYNRDTAVHTLTSGTGSGDTNSGKAFDTGFINPGKSATFSTDKLAAGTYQFYCQVHPFMKGNLTLTS